MKPKIIKSEAEHTATLARIEAIFDAKPGTPEGDELELLSTLVELYEREAYPIEAPDPLEAIRFRMEQANLKPKDLIPYLGSASKVSEVLSGKRVLSVTMMRRLSAGLEIPAAVLLKEPKEQAQDFIAQAQALPIREMTRRGWFPGFAGTLKEARQQIDKLMQSFVGPLGANALHPALNRQRIRSGSKSNEPSLTAWRVRVITLALQERLAEYKRGTVTADFLRKSPG